MQEFTPQFPANSAPLTDHNGQANGHASGDQRGANTGGNAHSMRVKVSNSKKHTIDESIKLEPPRLEADHTTTLEDPAIYNDATLGKPHSSSPLYLPKPPKALNQAP